jgi:UrcA family protein
MRRILATALVSAAGLLAPVAALAQAPADADADAIVITAPHGWVVGRSGATGAPIVDSVARIVVSYRDLDLRTPSGRDVLTARVASAARKACEHLNRDTMPNDLSTPSPQDCPTPAAAAARAQVDTAIRTAGG